MAYYYKYQRNDKYDAHMPRAQDFINDSYEVSSEVENFHCSTMGYHTNTGHGRCGIQNREWFASSRGGRNIDMHYIGKGSVR